MNASGQAPRSWKSRRLPAQESAVLQVVQEFQAQKLEKTKLDRGTGNAAQ
jgi:hypothetical protein